MYAIISTGGKQYKVAQGDEIFVEKIVSETGCKINLPILLLVADDGTVTTTDIKATVTCEVLTPMVKGKKVVVYKYKAKKNSRKKSGHRQQYTKLKVESIG